MWDAPKGSKVRPDSVEGCESFILFGAVRPNRVVEITRYSQMLVNNVGITDHAPKLSCRISPQEALVVIEEVCFMKFNHEATATAAQQNDQQLLGPSDVAKWLGVSAGWVRDHATRKDPRIRAIKVGKLLRFRPKDVEDFLRESNENAA